MEVDEPAAIQNPAIHSVTSNSFHRKTKTGKIIKIVRERYLRKDITCGKRSCNGCRVIGPVSRSAFDDEARNGLSGLVPSRHLVIPDVDTVISQIDVLEDPEFGNDVVILQTVVSEVRTKNLKTFSRLRTLITTESRRFNVFSNEFHFETYVNRKAGESGIDYSRRLVQVAHEWFNRHSKDFPVVLLSTKATGDNSLNFTDYVKSLKTCNKLVDKLAVIDQSKDDDPKELRFLYPEHLAESSVLGGVKKGKFYSGRYRTSRSNYLEGSVTINKDGIETEVLIQGRMNINRAVDGDTIAIELLPESLWVSATDVVLEPGIEEDDEEMAGEKANLETEVGVKRITGKVVGIIRRNWKSYCGSLKKRSLDLPKSMTFTTHLFVPKVPKIPLVRIESRQLDLIENQRIVVAIDSWPRDSKYPKGHYVRSLGQIGDKDAEREALLLEHDVPYHSFSQNVLKCLPMDPDNWKITPEEYKKRDDLRDYFVCSVDPPGCTDIDDALHCRELENGDYEIGVHIADVSYFVKPNTALDLEASSRGTTVYLVDKRIDMIPTVLSSNLCSLKGGVERLTFSVIWIMDNNTAEIKDTVFKRSVIKSKAALTYAEAQAKIDSSSNDELTKGLRRLNEMAKILKSQRLGKGALVLANAGEIKFIEVESETHENITEIQTKKMLDTNSMVEEFMLLANISVAEKIHAEFPELALLRRHPQPTVADFEQVLLAAKARGFEINASTGKDLSRTLNLAKDSKNPYFNTMLRMLTTRCMTPAEYFCSGSLDSNLHLKHFGLAADIYTHFTSPIRRYADLVVHRLLAFAIGSSQLDTLLLNKNKIQSLCDNINYRHKNAQYASRASNKLHTIEFIKGSKKLLEESAYIFQVKRNALEIFIPSLALELSYFTTSSDWVYDPMELKQTHSPTGMELKVFDPITIHLGVVDKSNEFRRGNEHIDIRIIKPTIDEPLARNSKK